MRWSDPCSDAGRRPQWVPAESKKNASFDRLTSNRILSEIPCRVSSDLHEWRNDLATVSTRDPAKLHDE
jgi:hypothetical protein